MRQAVGQMETLSVGEAITRIDGALPAARANLTAKRGLAQFAAV